MRKEIIRMFVPACKLINDNSAQNYKSKMGKFKWLMNQTSLLVEGIEGPFGFKIPTPEEIWKLSNNGQKFGLILEHWKLQRAFDLTNYGSSYKYLIDILTSNNYWLDDNHRVCNPVIFSGGDFSSWKEKAIRFSNDNLPENLTKEFWIDNGFDYKKDSFFRIIIDSNTRI